MYSCQELLDGAAYFSKPKTLENAHEILVPPSELKKMEVVAFNDFPTSPQILMDHCKKLNAQRNLKGLGAAVYLVKDKWIVIPTTECIYKVKGGRKTRIL